MVSKLTDADEELSEYFTSAIGLHAQPYEPSSGGGFDPRRADDALVRQLAHGSVRRFDAIGTTLARMRPEPRRVLEVIYTPFGTGFTPRRGSGSKDEEAPDFLAMALTPDWGHGSFVRLALSMPRTLRAFAKQHPNDSADPARVLGFLAFEAGKGDQRRDLFKKLRGDCESTRTVGLGMYEPFRVERESTEAARREASKAARAARGRELLDELLCKRRRAEAARFDRRLRGAS